MKRLVFIAVMVAACNQTNINTPVRVFNRPSDVALGCKNLDVTTQVFDAHPIADCAPDKLKNFTTYDSSGNLQFSPGNYPEEPTLNALVTQSASGEVASVDVYAAKVDDLQPAVPGFGFLPVGKLPEHVRISDDGCVGVTANVDSCDVATIDLPTMYNMRFLPFRDGGVAPDFAENVVRRLTPTVNGVPLGASPSWVEIASDTAPAVRGYETYQDPKHPNDPPGAIGVHGQCVDRHEVVNDPTSPAIPTKYHAWVALPNCQLVVELDVSAKIGNADGFTPAEVLQAIRVTRDSAEVVTDLSTLSCPQDCSGEAMAAPDGGVPDDVVDGGSRLPTTQAQPSTFAIDVEGNLGRMFIGDRVGERITIVPFDPKSGALGQPRAIALETGALGVQVVRISPRTPAGKFLYAVARDATVRVVDVDREAECETNPDPRALQAFTPQYPQSNPRGLGCFPLGDPSTPKRAPTMTSPGITLAGLALPRDVAFVHTDVPIAPADNLTAPAAGPSTLVGDFAWIFSSDGRGSVVNIYNACPAPNVPQLNNGVYSPACAQENSAISLATAYENIGNPVPMQLDLVSHRLRPATDRFFTPLNLSDNTGMPRLADDSNPFTLSVAGLPKSTAVTPGADGGADQLPALAPGPALPPPPPPFPAVVPTTVARYLAFFDPDRVRNEVWSLLWEGLLPGTHRTLGSIPSPMPNALPNVLVDAGGAFCDRSVLRGDKLVFPGCNVDTDCDYLESCAHDPLAPVDVAQGMCITRQDQHKFLVECSPLLRAVRRYRILSAREGVPNPDPSAMSGDLTDTLVFGEIYEPEHAVDTRVCDLKDAASCAGVTSVDATGLVHQTSCLEDSDGVFRCLRGCGKNAVPGDANPNNCGLDFQCLTSTMGDERCMLSPIDNHLFTDCMPELKTYEVHVGDSFLVSGSLTGVFEDLQADPLTRECEIPPVSSEYVRLHQSRIPVGTGIPCPASLTDPLAAMPNDLIDPATGVAVNACQLVGPGPSPSPVPPTIVHFENPYFSLLVDLPPGHEVPPDQFALTFQLLGSGFPLSVALAVDIQAQQPRYATVSPDGQTVFIVDEGSQSSGVGLHGQLLKLPSNAVSIDRSFLVR